MMESWFLNERESMFRLPFRLLKDPLLKALLQEVD